MTSPFIEQAMFMAACGQTISFDNVDQSVMYARLIDEEFEEFCSAGNEVDKADAVIDMIVVLIGYGLSRGWPMQELWNEVMNSNMAKIDLETGKVRRREDGKILKPEGWKAPDIAKVLREHA